jgi:thiol-disulfide isomerase/thioredoxin
MKTFVFLFVLFFSTGVFAQTKTPVGKRANSDKSKVTQIDETIIKNLLKPQGKPLLVNFWATWCEPCREEFPDLVKIYADYKGKIDLITISLDFPEDIDTIVPRFLSEMKAEMPTFLLFSKDESTVISSIKKDWNGGLPFTVLYNQEGKIAYFKEGIFNPAVLRSEIDKLLNSEKTNDNKRF